MIENEVLEALKNAPCQQKMQILRSEMRTPIESIKGYTVITIMSDDEDKVQNICNKSISMLKN